MKHLLPIALAVLALSEVTAHAQIDYLGNHLETMRWDNLRRHQQEMRRKSGKSSSTKRTTRTRTVRTETNLPASRLRVGDAIFAVQSGSNKLTFKGSGATVASRSPLRLNLRGTVAKPHPKGQNSPIFPSAFVTSTGRRSGVIGVLTFSKPNGMKFTRSGG